MNVYKIMFTHLYMDDLSWYMLYIAVNKIVHNGMYVHVCVYLCTETH